MFHYLVTEVRFFHNVKINMLLNSSLSSYLLLFSHQIFLFRPETYFSFYRRFDVIWKLRDFSMAPDNDSVAILKHFFNLRNKLNVEQKATENCW